MAGNETIGYQSWLTLYGDGDLPTLASAATPIRTENPIGGVTKALMSWGPIAFLVYPSAQGSSMAAAALNFNEQEHETAIYGKSTCLARCERASFASALQNTASSRNAQRRQMTATDTGASQSNTLG